MLDRAVDMKALGHHSGDPHLHFTRRDDADDRVILDLMEAEDIRYGSILAYNEPAGPVQRRHGGDGLAPAPRPGEGLGRAPRRLPRSPRGRSIAAARMGI